MAFNILRLNNCNDHQIKVLLTQLNFGLTIITYFSLHKPTYNGSLLQAYSSSILSLVAMKENVVLTDDQCTGDIPSRI